MKSNQNFDSSFGFNQKLRCVEALVAILDKCRNNKDM